LYGNNVKNVSKKEFLSYLVPGMFLGESGTGTSLMALSAEQHRGALPKNLRRNYLMYSKKKKSYDTSESQNTYNKMRISPNRSSIIYKRFLDGAYVNLMVDNSTNKPNPFTNTLIETINYKVFVSYLCSAYNLNTRTYNTNPLCDNRSPRGLPRQLLCEMLIELLEKEEIELGDNICLYANPSPNLVKMYERMGFMEVGRLISNYESWIQKGNKGEPWKDISYENYMNYFNNAESIMLSTVQKILKWCKK
jgi:hypothetical protein